MIASTKKTFSRRQMKKMAIDTSIQKEELLCQIEDLSAEMLKELLDFTYYLKAKEFIDPSQAYFWTKKWQEMEKEADQDKKNSRLLGDGTIKGLLNELKA